MPDTLFIYLYQGGQNNGDNGNRKPISGELIVFLRKIIMTGQEHERKDVTLKC